MTLKNTLVFCPLLLALACNEKSNFGGGVSAGKAPVALEKDSSVADTTDDVTPSPSSQDNGIEEEPIITPVPDIPECDPGQVGITKVKLLSTGIDLRQTNHNIKYEISLLSCKDGSKIPIKNQPIWFDLDLAFSGNISFSDYSVSNANTGDDIARGQLHLVRGSDLFGNKGDFFHWETDSLSYETSDESLTLEVILKNVSLQARRPGDTQVDTYLKIGETPAAQQKIQRLD